MENVLLVVCAAGSSSRMAGKDKLLLEIDGQSMLRRIVSAACEVEADVLVAHRPNRLQRFKDLAGLPARNVVIGSAKEGLSGTLRTAATYAAGYDYMMVVLADLPKLSAIHMARMMRAIKENPKAKIIRAVGTDGQTGHPTVFHKSLFKKFAALSGDAGAQQIVKAQKRSIVDVEIQGDACCFDIDTPQDFAAFQAAQPLTLGI